jgi:hypothetical protein
MGLRVSVSPVDLVTKGSDNLGIIEAANNSLNLTENGRTASPRDLTAPRINVQWTRGGATLSDVHSAAG